MNKNKVLNITLLISWMILIFVMSCFNAQESSSQSGFIVDILSKFVNINDIGIISVFVRKAAHFSEYIILGILALNCFKDYKIKNLVILSITFCILYAVTDEIHQTFVPGRAGLITDVIIDSCGSISGIIFYYFAKIRKVKYEK